MRKRGTDGDDRDVILRQKKDGGDQGKSRRGDFGE